MLEVNLDTALPVFVEVPVGDDVVVFDRLRFVSMGYSHRHM